MELEKEILPFKAGKPVESGSSREMGCVIALAGHID
jgi:hypothetical protein